MRIAFPYPDIPPLEIPDTHPTTIYEVPSVRTGDDEARLIRESIEHPIAMERFSRLLSPDSRVLLVVDDISRPTDLSKILPPLLKEVQSAGIPDSNIRILIALGTHRPMTPAEIEQKMGAEIPRRYRVINHEWDNPAALHDFGSLPDGTRVILNKELTRADFIIGVGTIAPHPAAGFSGGGKIIAPGVATEEAAGNFHWKSVQFPEREVLGVRDNPMRAIIDRIAAMAGLSAIVNVVTDSRQQIVAVVSGDPVAAHRAGCQRALELYGVKVVNPDRYDIFIADSHPMDQDMWQAVKGLCAMDVIAPDQAVTILVTPCPEGVAPMHPEILTHGYLPVEEASRLVETAGLSKVAAHNMVQGGRLLRRTHAMIVSPGISPAEAGALGFIHCATPQEALTKALQIKGAAARIMVLKMGGDMAPLPVAEG
jgi:nickel-dependent lactate racemase